MLAPKSHRSPRALAGGAVTRWYAHEWQGSPADDPGHIRGTNEGGSGTDPTNIFAQNKGINRGQFRAWCRRMILRIRASGKPAFVTVDLYTRPGEIRPFEYAHKYTIDGQTYRETFPNPP